MAEASSISGAEKAAILLMSLGEQDAAAVLKQLDARACRSSHGDGDDKEVPRERVNEVMNTSSARSRRRRRHDAVTEFVRRVLTNSVGKQRADMLLDRILSGAATGGRHRSAALDGSQGVAQLIAKEHPQSLPSCSRISTASVGRGARAAAEEMRPMCSSASRRSASATVRAHELDQLSSASDERRDFSTPGRRARSSPRS